MASRPLHNPSQYLKIKLATFLNERKLWTSLHWLSELASFKGGGTCSSCSGSIGPRERLLQLSLVKNEAAAIVEATALLLLRTLKQMVSTAGACNVAVQFSKGLPKVRPAISDETRNPHRAASGSAVLRLDTVESLAEGLIKVMTP